MMRLAVSSSCCPRLGAAELAAAVAAAGGDAVELRIGRGHAWEASGAPAVAAGGVTVTAVASSRSFGAEPPEGEEDVRQAASVGARLRCFLDPRCDFDVAALERAQVQVAAVQRTLGGRGSVAVEPHPGHASVPAVVGLCAAAGAVAVADLLALRRLGWPLRPALAQLAGATWALHVKGFEREEGIWRHRPLAAADLPDAKSLAPARRVAVAVVETQAGSHWRDLHLLRGWAARVGTR
jgi:hypothetical protein